MAHAGGVCITDQITDQYAPYCSELRYAVSSDYIELADYWWMQQEMNTLSPPPPPFAAGTATQNTLIFCVVSEI